MNENTKLTPVAREIAALMELSATTKAELQDPDRRAQIAETLVENGIFPSRTECQDFVQLMADQASGVPLVPSMKKWLDECNTCLSQWLKAQSARDLAFVEHNNLNRLKERCRRLSQSILLERERLGELEAWANNVVPSYRSQIVGDHSKTSTYAANFAKDRLGALEGARLLKEEIIPGLEKELSEIEGEITRYLAAISV